MRDLTQHLTARADDNHAAPHYPLRRESYFHSLANSVRAQVRFLAYHRIKPHAPPLVRTPVNSFEFHACARTPQVAYLTVSLGRPILNQTSSKHRLGRGLPGYLILFAPHAFVPQRRYGSGRLPTQSVFCGISKHFTATCRVPPASRQSEHASIKGSSTVGRWDFTPDLARRLRTL